jgi:hypothetical protein
MQRPASGARPSDTCAARNPQSRRMFRKRASIDYLLVPGSLEVGEASSEVKGDSNVRLSPVSHTILDLASFTAESDDRDFHSELGVGIWDSPQQLCLPMHLTDTPKGSVSVCA